MDTHRRKLLIGVAGALVLPTAAAKGQNTAKVGESMSDRPAKGPFDKRIGIIGGLALRAGVFYYEQLLKRATAAGKPLDLVLLHADVTKVLGFITSGDKQGLGTYLGTLSNSLFDAGADVVAVSAVATHLAFAETAKVARGPLANVIDTIGPALADARLQKVAVFGNRAVMQTNIFGALRDDQAVKLPPAIVDEVHATYNGIALNGKRGTEPEKRRLAEIARALMTDQGAQAVVLAGTDLSSFYAESPPEFPFVDMAQLHVDQIVGLGTGAAARGQK